jgi:hypothetical protein
MTMSVFLQDNESPRVLMGIVLLMCCGCREKSIQLHIFLDDAPVQSGLLSVVSVDSRGSGESCMVNAGACELRGSWIGFYSCTLHASSADDAFSATSSSGSDDAVRHEKASLSTNLPPVNERVRSHAMQVDFREGARTYDLRFTAAHALEPSE